MNASGTQRSSSGIVSRKEDLSPEMLAKFEAYINRPSKSHPLYQTEGHSYGVLPTGETVELQSPAFAKAGNFSKHFLPRKNESRTTLDTAQVRRGTQFFFVGWECFLVVPMRRASFCLLCKF